MVIKEDQKCRCGWKLPRSVIAYRQGGEPEEKNEVPDSYVALVCPECNREHAFFVAVVE